MRRDTLSGVTRQWHRLMLRTSLQRRVSVMAGAFLAVILVLAVVLLSSVLRSLDLTERPDPSDNPTTDVSLALESVRGTFVELNTTHGLFISTGDVSRYRERLGLESQLVRQMRDLQQKADVGGQAETTESVDEIAEGFNEWRAIADEQAALKYRGTDQARLDALTAKSPAAAEFLVTFQQIDDLSEDLLSRERTSTNDAAADSDRVFWVSIGVVAVGMLLVPAAVYLVRRWVVRPLGYLADQLDRVGSGDLQTPVALQGPPELAAVAASAETMRRRILDELADAVSAREALKQGQPLVEEVREQLAAHDLPVIPGWSAAAALRPAEGLLAGDWYDVLPLRDGRYAVVVADVSGHGARAGIVAIQLKRLLEAALHLAPEPDLALAMAARVFSDEAERFASCVVAVVDPDSGVVNYANAGHPAPFVVRVDDGDLRVVSELEATGPLLSWLHLDEPGAWGIRTVSLAPGSSLVVYTDGLTEARPTGSTDELGIEGVLRALAELPELTPEIIVDEALDVARRWSGGRARDDVTLVVLARQTAAAAGASVDAGSGAGLPAARDGADGAR